MKMKMIVDTDGGVDDSGALVLALSQPSSVLDITAITTTHGNIPCSTATANVARLLRLTHRQDVPLYKGATAPLLPPKQDCSAHRPTFYHGTDGQGDETDAVPARDSSDLTTHHPSRHAVSAILEICRVSYKSGEKPVIVCLGPLTNLALALKLNPDLGKEVEALYLMGGNLWGPMQEWGNVYPDSTAEFNFFNDPEAAHIVLEQLNAPIYAVPWENYILGNEKKKDRDFPDDAWLALDSPLSRFLAAITKKGLSWCQQNKISYSFCDELAMACALRPHLIQSTRLLRASVELSGDRTRGMVAVDWVSSQTATLANPLHSPNVHFITDIDRDALAHFAVDTVRDWSPDLRATT